MSKDTQRRLLLLLKLLYEQTDEEHMVSVADILQYWEKEGIHANRKNVYRDIQLLMDFGVDVICIRSMQNRYFIGSRLFELPELKLLADAVGVLPSRYREEERRPAPKTQPAYQRPQCGISKPPCLHGRYGQAGQRDHLLCHRRHPDRHP